jgi:hypothetical protein
VAPVLESRGRRTPARKAHFAEQNEKREVSRWSRSGWVKEAESLADSTEWGATAGQYRT